MKDYDSNEKAAIASAKKLFWTIVTIVYLWISFTTGKWAISWLVWLVAVALEQAATMFYYLFKAKDDNKSNVTYESEAKRHFGDDAEKRHFDDDAERREVSKE